MAAQPREMVVGNIVRRVLGLIRDEAEDDRDAEFTLSDAGSESQPQTPRLPDGPFFLMRGVVWPRETRVRTLTDIDRCFGYSFCSSR